MNFLHPWKVNTERAIQIQENLKSRILQKNGLSEYKTIAGADVSYSKGKNSLSGAIVVLSFPDMNLIEQATASGEITFPYIPGLLTFREGPILIKTFQRLRKKPDLIIFDGQGIAHPRRIGLASHLGLWFDIPSIGCAKTLLTGEFKDPGPFKGDYEWIFKDGEKLGAVLRTKDLVKPLFISPGHRIDLYTSMNIVLKSCIRFRIPEPLRKAHQLSRKMVST